MQRGNHLEAKRLFAYPVYAMFMRLLLLQYDFRHLSLKGPIKLTVTRCDISFEPFLQSAPRNEQIIDRYQSHSKTTSPRQSGQVFVENLVHYFVAGWHLIMPYLHIDHGDINEYKIQHNSSKASPSSYSKICNCNQRPAIQQGDEYKIS